MVFTAIMPEKAQGLTDTPLYRKKSELYHSAGGHPLPGGMFMEELFKRFDALVPLQGEARRALQAICREEHYPRLAIIQKTDNRCQTLYFVTEGIARIFYHQEGRDITAHFAFDGQMIVRAESLYTGKPSERGIQALTDCRVVALSTSALFPLYDAHPEIGHLFRRLLEQEHLATLERVASLQVLSATERYVALRQETPLVNQIPLKHIASYLGITPESLSRIRAALSA